MGDALEMLGMALLVGFAATFGLRWALLAGAVVAIVLGLALADTGWTLHRPSLKRWRNPEQPYGVVRGDL